jgi:HlyD family secretion protein
MKSVLNLMKNKKARNWGIVVIVVLIAILLVPRILPGPNLAMAQTTEAKVVSLNVAETVDTSGSLQAQPFASLEWKADGVVETVNVQAGAMVKSGDVLLSLQTSSTSSNIVSAQADLVQAQKDLEELLNSDTDRAQAVIDLQDAKEAYEKAYNWRVELNGETWITDYKYKSIRGQQVLVPHTYRGYAAPETIADADRDLALKKSELEDTQRAYDRLANGPNEKDVAAAQAKVDAAQATVNSLSIIAPFDGEVLSVSEYVGDTVSTGDLSVNLADLNHLYVEAEVDESDIAKIKVGNPIEATLDAVPGVKLTGVVSVINPVGEIDSGLVKYKVRIDLDTMEDSSFIPLGTTVNVTIQVKEATQSLAVPITAIQNDDKGEYVSVIKEDGSTVRVNVVSGNIVGNLVTVTGNLQEGDRVSTQSIGNQMPGGGSPFGG